MASLFTQIIAGEVPGQIVWQDEGHVALLTIAPIYEGHTLVIPRKEVDSWLEMSDVEYVELMLACKKVGDILKDVFNKNKVVQIIQGFEVSHVHVHLIPANNAEECPFPPSRMASAEELKIVAKKIRQ